MYTGKEVTGTIIFSITHGLFHTGEVQGFICYFDNRALCIGSSIDLPGGLSQELLRECCIARNGFAYNLFHGDEECTECIGERILNRGGFRIFRRGGGTP